jgi:hypothetical protein
MTQTHDIDRRPHSQIFICSTATESLERFNGTENDDYISRKQ